MYIYTMISDGPLLESGMLNCYVHFEVNLLLSYIQDGVLMLTFQLMLMVHLMVAQLPQDKIEGIA